MERIYRLFALAHGLRGVEAYHFVVLISTVVKFRWGLNDILADALKSGLPHKASALPPEIFEDSNNGEVFKMAVSATESNNLLTGCMIATINSSNEKLIRCATKWMRWIWIGARVHNNLLAPGLACNWRAPLERRYENTFFHLF